MKKVVRGHGLVQKTFAGTREVRLQTVLPTQAGKYTATYTDDYGRQSSIDFTIAVEGTTICPELISYINYGGWKNVNEMEVKERRQCNLRTTSI